MKLSIAMKLQWNYAARSRGELAVLGRRKPWANRFFFFKKYEKKNLQFFTWSWNNDFGYLCPSLIEKIGFPFFKKKKTSFSRDKSKFFIQSFSLLKLAKLNFHF